VGDEEPLKQGIQLTQDDAVVLDEALDGTYTHRYGDERILDELAVDLGGVEPGKLMLDMRASMPPRPATLVFFMGKTSFTGLFEHSTVQTAVEFRFRVVL